MQESPVGEKSLNFGQKIMLKIRINENWEKKIYDVV